MQRFSTRLYDRDPTRRRPQGALMGDWQGLADRSFRPILSSKKGNGEAVDGNTDGMVCQTGYSNYR